MLHERLACRVAQASQVQQHTPALHILQLTAVDFGAELDKRPHSGTNCAPKHSWHKIGVHVHSQRQADGKHDLHRHIHMAAVLVPTARLEPVNRNAPVGGCPTRWLLRRRGPLGGLARSWR